LRGDPSPRPRDAHPRRRTARPTGQHRPLMRIGATGFGQPDLDPSLTEPGSHVAELITGGESALVLSHHDRVEPALPGFRRGQQRSGPRPARPRQPPRTTDVEELLHDPPAPGDHRLGHLALPPTRRTAVLVVDRRRPAIEPEPQGWTTIPFRRVAAPTSGIALSRPTGKPTTTAVLLINHSHRRRIDITDRQTAPEPGRRQDHERRCATVQFLRRHGLLPMLIIGSRRVSGPITVRIAHLAQPTGQARTCSSAARCPVGVMTAVLRAPAAVPRPWRPRRCRHGMDAPTPRTAALGSRSETEVILAPSLDRRRRL
jgi:hypothetical protein